MSAPLEYVWPHRLEEALEFLCDHGKETTIVAGGTDVLIGLRSGALQNRYLMDVSRLSELKGIELNEEGLCVGAGVTLSEIYTSKTLARFAPALQKAAFHFGSKQIRNMATIGGNAGNASPSADTVPPLITHDARAVLGNISGERIIPIEELFIGPYRSAVRSDEVITRFILEPSEGMFTDFQKIVRRKALAISRISMAVMAERDAEGKIVFMRLALGSCTPTPRRIREVEDFFTGKRPDEALIRKAGRILATKMVEISGQRASTVYKEKAVQGLLMRMLYDLI
ncbi:MAG: FAD binding domain-containing protein [Deltaproteobacteria bacterium]|nr:FAD binding domain-containing protein [Deltaproteobacteria bacterium]